MFLWYHKKKPIDAPIITSPPPIKIPATFVLERAPADGEGDGEGEGLGDDSGDGDCSSFSPRTVLGDFLGEGEGDFGEEDGEFLGEGLGDFAGVGLADWGDGEGRRKTV